VRGTTTNLEGRISTVAQKVTSPGTAQSDWVIAADLSRRMGYDLGIESPEQVWDELRQVSPLFADLGDILADAPDSDGVVVEWPSRRIESNGHADESATADGEGEGDEAASTDAAEVVTDAAEAAELTGGGDTDMGDAAAVEQSALSGDAIAPPAGDAGHLLPSNGAAPGQVPLPDWTVVEPPPVDAYGLRLVATRKLYDRGTLLRHSPSLVGLAEGAALRLNPYDFERLGVAPGDEARVTSARTHVLVPVRPSESVPRGVALLHVNQSGGRVNALLDAKMVATDVRVERP